MSSYGLNPPGHVNGAKVNLMTSKGNKPFPMRKSMGKHCKPYKHSMKKGMPRG